MTTDFAFRRRTTDGVSPLSREDQVLRLIAKDLTNLVIGERLGISNRAVASYISQACKKHGLTDRTALAQWVRENPQAIP